MISTYTKGIFLDFPSLSRPPLSPQEQHFRGCFELWRRGQAEKLSSADKNPSTSGELEQNPTPYPTE